ACRSIRSHCSQPLFNQLRLGTDRRFPGHVHAGWIHVGRDGALPGEKRVTHCSNEHDDLSARLSWVLGVRLRDWLGKLVEWSRSAWLVSLPRSWTFGFERRLGTRCGSRCGGEGDG